MTEQDTLENSVAMDVVNLCGIVIQLSSHAAAPEAAALLARDYEEIAGAHAQLGRILNLLPRPYSVAAE